MVERFQSKKIVVVDLDGTLLDGNSLHQYFLSAFKHSNFLIKLKIGWILFLRKIRFISHKYMKFTLIRSIAPNDRIQKDFVFHTKNKIRKEVLIKLDEFRSNGAEVLLATAAPDFYVPWIWDGKFVATTTVNNYQKECRGKEKLRAVKEFMGHDSILEAVITDHSDDLPLLMEGAKYNILVNPDKKTLDIIKHKNIAYKIL